MFSIRNALIPRGLLARAALPVWVLAVAAAPVWAATIFGPAAASAQSSQPGQAQLSVRLPVEQVTKDGPEFQVDILADNVTNLAAFKISLTYDAAVIAYSGVDIGPFLGSTGREPKCFDPQITSQEPATLEYSCVTLGPPVSIPGATAGASGSGVLATVKFVPLRDGNTSIDLKEGTLIAAALDEDGMPLTIAASISGAALEVAPSGGGTNWLLWGAVAGVAVVVLAGGTLLVLRRKGLLPRRNSRPA